MISRSFDRFCDVLTTVATLKVDFTEGKAKARTPGPSGSLKSSFRNAKKLLYFLAEIKAFWFRLGGNRSKVFACAMMGSLSVRAALCLLQAFLTSVAREYLTWWFMSVKERWSKAGCPLVRVQI